MIPGGYILKSRKIKDSPVHRMPPYVREIWDYCLREANHHNANYGPHIVERGQLFRTYKDIREDLCWYVGYRKMMYNENHTKKAMKALREAGMITTSKELGGVLITVLKYDYYQDKKNYERTKEGTTESTTIEPLKNHPIPANNKKNKKKKEEIEKPENITNQTWNDFLVHRKKKKASVTQTVINTFIEEAKKAGWTLEDALKECMNRGWQGFKAEWVENKDKKNKYDYL